jgi:hypothetical protein
MLRRSDNTLERTRACPAVGEPFAVGCGKLLPAEGRFCRQLCQDNEARHAVTAISEVQPHARAQSAAAVNCDQSVSAIPGEKLPPPFPRREVGSQCLPFNRMSPRHRKCRASVAFLRLANPDSGVLIAARLFQSGSAEVARKLSIIRARRMARDGPAGAPETCPPG